MTIDWNKDLEYVDSIDNKPYRATFLGKDDDYVAVRIWNTAQGAAAVYSITEQKFVIPDYRRGTLRNRQPRISALSLKDKNYSEEPRWVYKQTFHDGVLVEMSLERCP
jgi:hypothetical protein